MSSTVFFISLVIVLIIFFMRKKIVAYIFEEFDIYIQSEVVVYITSIAFIALILVGMLFDGTKDKYSSISKNFDNIRPKPNDQPHRYFNIDFDSLFPNN